MTTKKRNGRIFAYSLSFFLILIPISFASNLDYNNFLTRSIADYTYCKIYGNCWLDTLFVNNLTVLQAINMTIINYNVTGDIYVDGDIYFSGNLNGKQPIYNNTNANYNLTVSNITVLDSICNITHCFKLPILNASSSWSTGASFENGSDIWVRNFKTNFTGTFNNTIVENNLTIRQLSCDKLITNPNGIIDCGTDATGAASNGYKINASNQSNYLYNATIDGNNNIIFNDTMLNETYNKYYSLQYFGSKWLKENHMFYASTAIYSNPWVINTINNGTILQASVINSNTSGVVNLSSRRSNTAGASGYGMTTGSTTDFILGTGYGTTAILRPIAYNSVSNGTRIYFGFIDQLVSITSSIDGLYFSFNQTSPSSNLFNIYCRIINNNVETRSNYTNITSGEWIIASILIINNTKANCKLYNLTSGNLIVNLNVSGNIPMTAERATGHGIVSFLNGSMGSQLLDRNHYGTQLDYINVFYDKDYAYQELKLGYPANIYVAGGNYIKQ